LRGEVPHVGAVDAAVLNAIDGAVRDRHRRRAQRILINRPVGVLIAIAGRVLIRHSVPVVVLRLVVLHRGMQLERMVICLIA